MSYQTKNYQKPGGDEMHIGGILVFDAGGTVENLPMASEGESGGVLQAAAQADSTAATLADLVTDFNALLAKLRASGALADA